MLQQKALLGSHLKTIQPHFKEKGDKIRKCPFFVAVREIYASFELCIPIILNVKYIQIHDI